MRVSHSLMESGKNAGGGSLSLPAFVFLGQVNMTEPSFLTSLTVGENAVLLT